MINLGRPIATFSEAAKIGGVGIHTLRKWFDPERELLSLTDIDRDTKGAGFARLLSGRTVLSIAITAELVANEIQPRRAVEAAKRFAHSGTMEKHPGELFKEGYTVLCLYRGGISDVKNVLLGGKEQRATTAFDMHSAPGYGAQLCVTTLILNDLWKRVVAELEAL